MNGRSNRAEWIVEHGIARIKKSHISREPSEADEVAQRERSQGALDLEIDIRMVHSVPMERGRPCRAERGEHAERGERASETSIHVFGGRRAVGARVAA
jgi:hypothetical protein